MKKIIWFFFFLLVVVTSTAFAAEQTDNCHCFRNRVYTPADRYAADDYLLTTVFNSITAQYFSISKRQIVMMKMKGGVSNDELLIGLYVSQCTGTDVNNLLAQKRKRTWPEVLSSLKVQIQAENNCRQIGTLKNGQTGNKTAGNIIQKMLKDHFTTSDNTMRSLREQDLDPKEIALVLTLASHLDVKPDVIYTQYKQKKFSWSEIAYNFGLEPAEVGKLQVMLPSTKH